MFQKFDRMARRDERVGRESIEQFLGEELAATVKKVDEEQQLMLDVGFSED